jgi:hypothetical protein
MTLFDMHVSWFVIWAGYLAAGVWLGIVKRWPLRAGLAMMFFVLLPMFSRDLYWGGTGSLGIILVHGTFLIIAALLIIGSLLVAWFRWAFGPTKKSD